MKLIQNDVSRFPTPAQSSEAPATPSAAQTAAKWAGIALDPRPAAKLLGRTGVALTALALQPRGAAAYTSTSSSCYDYKNFQSPNSHDEYAVQAGCGSGHRYLQRFIDKCGAVPSNGGYPAFWHIVHYWGGPELLRQHSSQAANDTAFVSCLVHEGGQLAKHDWKIAGIVIGSVVGAIALGFGAWFGIRACCNGGGGSTIDAAPAQANATELSAATAAGPTVPSGALPPLHEGHAAKFEELPI